MFRAIRFLGVLPFLFVSGNAPESLEIPEADEIPNWPAPAFWTPPAARTPGGARTQAVSPALPPLPFIAVTPCRIADTRGNGFTGQAGAPSLTTASTRDFQIGGTVPGVPSQCGIPSTAAAVSFNFAVTNITANGNLVVYPTGAAQPVVSSLNYQTGFNALSNAATIPLGTSASITVKVNGLAQTVDFIADVNGYYEGNGSLQLSLSRRAALDQFWTSQNGTVLGLTAVGTNPLLSKSDGADIWVASYTSGSVSRVRASDGRFLESWTGATAAYGILAAMGRIFVTGETSPGQLYRIDPTQVAGAVTVVASNLGNTSEGIAFDGAKIWTANAGAPGSVSIITPGAVTPWAVTTVTTGFTNPVGALYDGTNIWVTDGSAGKLFKLDSAGAILQTVTVGSIAQYPVFDGTNIWVPNASSNSVTVVRASSGAVVQTLTGNGLSGPTNAAFDGQRVLVTNYGGSSVSLWKAADLTPLGSFSTGTSTNPTGVCSDGVNFWISLQTPNKLARF